MLLKKVEFFDEKNGPKRIRLISRNGNTVCRATQKFPNLLFGNRYDEFGKMVIRQGGKKPFIYLSKCKIECAYY